MDGKRGGRWPSLLFGRLLLAVLLAVLAGAAGLGRGLRRIKLLGLRWREDGGGCCGGQASARAPPSQTSPVPATGKRCPGVPRLTASSTVKNTLPPMPIHITRGCQPLEMGSRGSGSGGGCVGVACLVPSAPCMAAGGGAEARKHRPPGRQALQAQARSARTAAGRPLPRSSGSGPRSRPHSCTGLHWIERPKEGRRGSAQAAQAAMLSQLPRLAASPPTQAQARTRGARQHHARLEHIQRCGHKAGEGARHRAQHAVLRRLQLPLHQRLVPVGVWAGALGG